MADETERAQEGICGECGKDYPVWVAPNALWNATMREYTERGSEVFLCPTCFASLAEERGVMRPTAWTLLPTDDELHEQLLRARRHWPGERVEILPYETADVRIERAQSYLSEAGESVTPIEDAKDFAEDVLALAAELAAAERERDALREAEFNERGANLAAQAKLRRVEKRNGELEAALRLIDADALWNTKPGLRRIARAALAASGAGEETT